MDKSTLATFQTEDISSFNRSIQDSQVAASKHSDNNIDLKCHCNHKKCICDDLLDIDDLTDPTSDSASIYTDENNTDIEDNVDENEEYFNFDLDFNDHGFDPEYVAIISKLSPPPKIPVFKSRTNVDDAKDVTYNDIAFSVRILMRDMEDVKKKISTFISNYNLLPSITDIGQLCEYASDEETMSLSRAKELVEFLVTSATDAVDSIKEVQNKYTKIRETEGRLNKIAALTPKMMKMLEDIEDHNADLWIQTLGQYAGVIKQRETYFSKSTKTAIRERKVAAKEEKSAIKKASKLAMKLDKANLNSKKTKRIIAPIVRDDAFVRTVNNSREIWLQCIVKSDCDIGFDLGKTIEKYSFRKKNCWWWTEQLSDFYYDLLDNVMDLKQAINFFSNYIFPMDVMDCCVETTFVTIIKAFIISCYRFDTDTNLHYFRHGDQWKMLSKFPVCHNIGIKRENINSRKYFVIRSNLYDHIMDTGIDFYGVQCFCAPELPPSYNNIATPYKWLNQDNSDASNLLLVLINSFGEQGASKFVSLFSKKQILAISCDATTKNNLIKLLEEFYGQYCIECNIAKIIDSFTSHIIHSRMIYFSCSRIRNGEKYDDLIDYVNSTTVGTIIDNETITRKQYSSVVIFCDKNLNDDIDTIVQVSPFNMTDFSSCCKDLYRISQETKGGPIVTPCASCVKNIEEVSILNIKEMFIQRHIEVFSYFEWADFEGELSFDEKDVVVTPSYYIVRGIRTVKDAFFPNVKVTNEEIQSKVIDPLNEYFNLHGNAAIIYSVPPQRKSFKINGKSNQLSGIFIPRTKGRVVPIPRT